jgi:hypothetical protein
MKKFHEETGRAGWRFEAIIVRPEQLKASGLEDVIEQMAVMGIAAWKKDAVDSGRRPLCLACEYEFKSFHSAKAFMVSRPLSDNSSMVIAVGVCPECAKRSDVELLKVAHKGFHEMGLAKMEAEWRVDGRR